MNIIILFTFFLVNVFYVITMLVMGLDSFLIPKNGNTISGND